MAAAASAPRRTLRMARSTSAFWGVSELALRGLGAWGLGLALRGLRFRVLGLGFRFEGLVLYALTGKA